MPTLPTLPTAAATPPAELRCTGGDYRCPDGWVTVPVSPPACPPGGPCPTYEPLCKGFDTRVTPHVQTTLPAKSAILLTLPPLTPGGGAADLSPWDQGQEKCEYVCPMGHVKVKTHGAPYLPPRCVPLDDPSLGSGVKPPTATVAVALGAAALLLGVAVWAGSRSKAKPNTRLASYLPRSPEAALMIMPPAIPSYLAYRYALRRMRPDHAELAEGWRDYLPYEQPDEQPFEQTEGWQDYDDAFDWQDEW